MCSRGSTHGCRCEGSAGILDLWFHNIIVREETNDVGYKLCKAVIECKTVGDTNICAHRTMVIERTLRCHEQPRNICHDVLIC